MGAILCHVPLQMQISNTRARQSTRAHGHPGQSLVFFSQDLTNVTTAYAFTLGISEMVALLTCHMCQWREGVDRP